MEVRINKSNKLQFMDATINGRYSQWKLQSMKDTMNESYSQ